MAVFLLRSGLLTKEDSNGQTSVLSNPVQARNFFESVWDPWKYDKSHLVLKMWRLPPMSQVVKENVWALPNTLKNTTS